MSRKRIIYKVKVWKEKASYKKVFCYFAETISIDDDQALAQTANFEGQDVSASQHDIAALAFCMSRKTKSLNKKSGNSFFFEFYFPTERSMGVDEVWGGLRFGLSDEEVEAFYEAFNDPNNPDPHN